MPQKWAISLAVEGPLRFLSHHDMMRAVERLLARAGLPLRYSQGFNPRPAISLVLPRPVGVTSRADLLVLSLDEPLPEQELLARMSRQAPAGLRPLGAKILAPGQKPRVRQASYELPLPNDKIPALGQKIQKLQTLQQWPIERIDSTERPENRSPVLLDIRPMVKYLRLQGDKLLIELVPRGDSWARPSEVLRLLGLDERADLARLTRTCVDYNL